MRRAIFTIVSANYIGFASTLMQSVATHHPDIDRYIILSDAIMQFPDLCLSATLIGCDDLGIPLLENMKLWYTVIEFNTAIKPFCFIYLLQELQFDQACYIDPDIMLFAPMREVFDALADHSCVLTPHTMKPLQDGKEPSDLTIMKSGVYNLGFLGLRNDVDAILLARWWSDRCFANCRVDIPGNMFTDQRWMDLAPAFLERPFILRHPGYNVAYWNLASREVRRAESGEWFVNGLPLVFFHFSGIKPEDRNQFSKHTNRFGIDNLGDVAILCDYYRSAVLSNGWLKYNKSPYAFGRFKSGRIIEDAMRHYIARLVDERALYAYSALDIDERFFDEPEGKTESTAKYLTRFMYQYWLDRRDLQAAFDVYGPSGAAAYKDWFVNDPDVAILVDARNVEAARLSGTAGTNFSLVNSYLNAPPWPPASSQYWGGAVSGIKIYLEQPIHFDTNDGNTSISRLMALTWERRADVQKVFPLTSGARVDDYIAWFICGQGCASRQPFISGEILARLRKHENISRYYGDVPISTGMIITRGIDISRTLGHWHNFPVERLSRLSHAIWYAFVAPPLFGWPDEMANDIRQYFHAPTDIKFGECSLSRGTLAIWELRSDVRVAFTLSSGDSIRQYITWLVTHIEIEVGISLQSLDPALFDFVQAEAQSLPGISNKVLLAYESRPDLRKAYDLGSAAGREGFLQWLEAFYEAEMPNFASSSKRGCSKEVDNAYRAKVALTGYLHTPSGRGEDLRCSVNALERVGFTDFVIVDLSTGSVIGRNDTILSKETIVCVEINIVHTNADTALEDFIRLRNLGLCSNKVVGYWAWELEELPTYWNHAFSFYDEVWAATRFAESAFVNGGLRPVLFAPMPVIVPEITQRKSRSTFGLRDDETVFLFMFDFRSFVRRKNPEGIIDAFLQAFPSGNENVRLILKTQGAADRPIAWRNLSELCSESRIEVRDGSMTREDVVDLISCVDCFVSLHRSEGFGRGPAEAMLLGLPTILTGYSGTCDFADDHCALIVPYELKLVSRDEYPGVDGQRWAYPDAAAAARHMRWIYHHPKDAKMLGQRARARIKRQYSADVCGANILRLIG